MRNKKGIVSRLLVVLVLIIGASSLFVGCKQSNDVKEKPSYTKKNISFSFNNQSGKDCKVTITNIHAKGDFIPVVSSVGSDSTEVKYRFDIPEFTFEITKDDHNKIVTLPDVVTSAKKADKTFTYNQEFEVYISALDGSGYKKFKSNTTEQFFSTRGYFKITWSDDPKGFIIDYFSN